jgi:hypothetical protein
VSFESVVVQRTVQHDRNSLVKLLEGNDAVEKGCQSGWASHYMGLKAAENQISHLLSHLMFRHKMTGILLVIIEEKMFMYYQGKLLPGCLRQQPIVQKSGARLEETEGVEPTASST